MKFTSVSVVAAALALSASQAFATVNMTAFDRRTMTTNPNDLDGQSYDYVIVGGGTAGLVLAGRLSAQSGNTVAVIEAGASGYDDNDKFTVPDADLYNSAVNTQYDWQWKTTRQSNLNNRRVSWPRGKVLGGSSAVNGLYYVRHSRIEQDAWASLNGNDGRWGWDNMLAHMQKSEHFRTPVSSVANQAHIQYDASSHGTNGPIGTTWPAVMYDPIGAFMEAANQVASPYRKDTYGGVNHGTYMALSTIDKTNWQRSFSRTGYLDPVSNRQNLHVLTGYQVTQVHFDRSNRNNVQATGVSYAKSDGKKWHTVHANKEVILCGGAINDPAILQLSGIGDSSLLKGLGIDVVVDLPGVGQNLQDHLSGGMSFSPKKQSDRGPTSVSGDPRRDSYVNSAVSYVTLKNLYGNTDDILGRIQRRAKNITKGKNLPSSVKQGQDKVYDIIANKIYPSSVSPIEILGNVMFGSISIQAAIQHPLSRGAVTINSKNPFDRPSIDAGYLSESLDLEILREGFKLARKISQTSPMKDHIASENSPGSSVQSDSDWNNWIRGATGTEYHPSSTCAMLPRADGGVVDTNLKVYGTSNLRVIDASVVPFSLSCHLMSVAYGIAEIGADIIMGH